LPTASRGEHLRYLSLENPIAFDIAERPALPPVAETAHPMPDVEKKHLTLLLAVVAEEFVPSSKGGWVGGLVPNLRTISAPSVRPRWALLKKKTSAP
jgi:hypothetical protein